MNIQEVSDRLYYAIRLYWENSSPGTCMAVKSAMADYKANRSKKEISAKELLDSLIKHYIRNEELNIRSLEWELKNLENNREKKL